MQDTYYYEFAEWSAVSRGAVLKTVKPVVVVVFKVDMGSVCIMV